jgi:dihydroorotase/allantoinase
MSESNVLIRGGSLVDSSHVYEADVRIRDGRVVEVGPGLRSDGEELIDASGLMVLPGVIDAHSHQWEAGLASRPDFRDDTASAAAGGITTIIDHPLTPPEVLTAQRLRDKIDLGNRTSLIDFALHAGVGSGDLTHLGELWNAGVTSFKLFTCDTGIEMAGFTDRARLLTALSIISGLRGLAIVHAEDQAILDRNRTRLESEGRTDVRYFGEWRSAEAEGSAINFVLQAAAEAACPVYFVHTSIPEGVDAIASARRRGVTAFAETCPHYLYLTESDFDRLGHRATTSPPVRGIDRRSRLRSQLADEIAVVGSDNGTVMPANKSTRDAFKGQPGIPGNETMLPLLLNLVAEGVIPLTRVVALVAEGPARMFGLSARKGFLTPGHDGDVTLVDVSAPSVISASRLTGVAGWTPYEGWSIRGRVLRTLVRGRTVAVDGRAIGSPGYGRFVPRTTDVFTVANER